MKKKREQPRCRKDTRSKGSPATVQHATNADLVAALDHPIRVEILSLMLDSDVALSPKQLASTIAKPLPFVAYHVRVLAEKSAIELTKEEAVRGSVAHFYIIAALIRKTPWVLGSLRARNVDGR
jgi:hypothetical protein